jgi:hypothetical protein
MFGGSDGAAKLAATIKQQPQKNKKHFMAG